MGNIGLFPYLSLEKEIRIGPWRVIPRKKLKKADAVSIEAFKMAPKHLALYALPHPKSWDASRAGCYVVPANGLLGGPIKRGALSALHLATLAGVLSENPRSQGKRGNSTSDNVSLFAHPMNPNGSIAIESGQMIRTLVGGVKAGINRGYIPPPPALHLCSPWTRVDEEVAGYLHDALVRGTDSARRMRTALEWLDIAWRNADSILPEMRVMALKSGFEVFLNVGERVGPERGALSKLLDPKNVKRSPQTYKERSGKSKTINVSDLEWWFTQFAFLRNAIAHGNPIPPAAWSFGGEGHIFAAQRILLEAICRRVGNRVNKPELSLRLLDRYSFRAGKALNKFLRVPGKPKK